MVKFRKISLIVVTAFALLTILSTSTFAWLQLNKDVWVEGMGINVTAGDNINVSIDGINFTQDISSQQIKRAIVAKYQGLSFDDAGYLLDESRNRLGDAAVDEYYSEIKLKPVTSTDGLSMYDKYGNLVKVKELNNRKEEGWFFEFDLYLKTTTTEGMGQHVPVYIYDSNEKTLENGAKVLPTKITSEPEDISLHNNVSIFDKTTGALQTLDPTVVNKLTVRAADAIRFSTSATNQVAEESSVLTKIFEPNEGLGSYATDYTSENYLTGASTAFMAKYDVGKNASYTYSVNRGFSEVKALKYEDMPKAITNLSDRENRRICSLSKGDGYTSKVTFRFWLEGNDADCIDGLKNIITAQLTFTTQEPTAEDPIEVTFNQYDGSKVIYSSYMPNFTLSPMLPLKQEGKKFIGWFIEGQTQAYDQNTIAGALATNKKIVLNATYQ